MKHRALCIPSRVHGEEGKKRNEAWNTTFQYPPGQALWDPHLGLPRQHTEARGYLYRKADYLVRSMSGGGDWLPSKHTRQRIPVESVECVQVAYLVSNGVQLLQELWRTGERASRAQLVAYRALVRLAARQTPSRSRHEHERRDKAFWEVYHGGTSVRAEKHGHRGCDNPTDLASWMLMRRDALG